MGDSKSRVFVGFKIWNPDREYSELIHPVYRMLRRLDEYRQLAEEKRLLYVAATRAQQQLFLLGRRTRSFSYSRWLIEAGAEDYAVDADDLPRSSAANNFRWPPPAPTAPMSRWNLFTEPISSPTQHFHWSTTEIARFSVCPRRLHLSREEVEPEEQQTARSLAAWLGFGGPSSFGRPHPLPATCRVESSGEKLGSTAGSAVSGAAGASSTFAAKPFADLLFEFALAPTANGHRREKRTRILSWLRSTPDFRCGR